VLSYFKQHEKHKWAPRPSLGTPNQNRNLNTVCHNRAVRHDLMTWYQQLPTDQRKNAQQNDLKQGGNIYLPPS
jgi:hypothetical protein